MSNAITLEWEALLTFGGLETDRGPEWSTLMNGLPAYRRFEAGEFSNGSSQRGPPHLDVTWCHAALSTNKP